MAEARIEGSITADPECVGKRTGAMLLAGTLEVSADGSVVFRLIGDYHLCYSNLPRTGEAVSLVFRHAADREKYPNWPKPEPSEAK